MNNHKSYHNPSHDDLPKKYHPNGTSPKMNQPTTLPVKLPLCAIESKIFLKSKQNVYKKDTKWRSPIYKRDKYKNNMPLSSYP